MSVLSTVALLVAAAVKPKRAERVAQLEADELGLEFDLADAKRERNDWRERALARGEQLISSIPASEAGLARANAQFAQAQQNAQAQQALLAMQQAFYHQAQQAQQNFASPYNQNQMLGAQLLTFHEVCNCVPSRTQVWAANGAEA